MTISPLADDKLLEQILFLKRKSNFLDYTKIIEWNAFIWFAPIEEIKIITLWNILTVMNLILR